MRKKLGWCKQIMTKNRAGIRWYIDAFLLIILKFTSVCYQLRNEKTWCSCSSNSHITAHFQWHFCKWAWFSNGKTLMVWCKTEISTKLFKCMKTYLAFTVYRADATSDKCNPQRFLTKISETGFYQHESKILWAIFNATCRPEMKKVCAVTERFAFVNFRWHNAVWLSCKKSNPYFRLKKFVKNNSDI